MKIFNRSFIPLLLLATIGFVGCEKAISELEVGIETVYIPQSLSFSTSDNNYNVPSKINFGDSKSFRVDDVNNKVEIFLGVAKGGKAAIQPFTVDVSSRADTVNQMISEGATFVLLPSSAYTLPTKVAVSEESSNGFYMTVNKDILKTYAGKKVAACVTISNPTKYTLDTSKNKVIVIIDVNALNLI